MEKCSGCQHYKDGKCSTTQCTVEENHLGEFKHIIGVMSGKGGVGKSSVTALLASALRKSGAQVGVLDGDIMGPSIARLFGVEGPAIGTEDGIKPVLSKTGIKIMSMNLLLPKETDPVIWRGPVISGVIKQFWQEVDWGKLDYLLIDFPPGTGDVALTVMQSIPLKGIIMVTSPQGLVQMIVEKGVAMANKMEVPIIGLLENMSYVQPPGYPEAYYLFGEGKTKEVSEALGLRFLGHFPIDRELTILSDRGEIETYESKQFLELAKDLMKLMD
ncbi:Mrp/NBP35 family ATP-binding protein [Alkaliphilus crotonatoxidans]